MFFINVLLLNYYEFQDMAVEYVASLWVAFFTLMTLLIILSASVSGLQSMLDCCFDVSRGLQLTFNCTKSCFAIGKGSRLRISNMNLGPNSIQWCDSLEYLAVTFHAGLKLKTNIEVIKQKFFMASNSVLGNSRSLDELIQLQLSGSFCLPILRYATCAVKLSSSQSA